ncbi:unnamed protein product [Bursaphelenchus okinawaensis]|uniref:Vacuolar protein sorting-associated protein 13 n=1 Tax=Bursaphelenchus okinawaensis TaxID=465554 RepID=A0A811JRZ9_9BILA|nr:unnamed protein product [Bursaphelenchus okinawaensis]CAG9080523.1 unnamed protein product [Bursaphelenchus okinawaensis]
MVFESVVADLLNRFLGDFVDNLDASQLNIGIWGGDVKLTNLDIKETAMDQLDLPVKLKFGCLDNLVLKIPWKNLYTEPVIANIEGLYLIVVPNKGVVYDDAKAKKNDHETKQKELLRLEENRKNRRKPKDPQADTFTEKLVAQVIKNLQVHIKNIHVRYEDKYTDRRRPFAAGITLGSLDFKTTDKDFKATIHKETLQIFYKLVNLQDLSIYWNSHSELISDLSERKAIRKALLETIGTAEKRLQDYKYILEPIRMDARLKLNQKPESDNSNWTIPKVDLGVEMERLALCIGRYQYQDILLFMEAQERFNLASTYLKYRPHLNEYKGHYKEWWRFAYTCILEENIRRKKNNWSWHRMKKHRNLVKEYKKSWVRKQTEKNLPSEITNIIENAEKKLDVFNLNIARQQAEMEIDRKNLTRLEDQPQGWTGWAKSWWSGGSTALPPGKTQDANDIAEKFQQAMTPEEKAKLFDAIDYQENTPPTDYPKKYVENRVKATLKTVAIIVEDALELEMGEIGAQFEQRPSARAICLKSSIKTLSMSGCGTPMLALLDENSDWLKLGVETNPLSGEFDQYVGLFISPTILRYHAPAINAAAEVFKPPESVRLNQLTAAALARYEDVKARSVSGLQHAVDQKSKLKLDIKIEPTTIVVSEGGVFGGQKPNLVTELGVLTIQTTDHVAQDSYKDVKDQRLRELMIKAYDKFDIKLSNMQLLFGHSFDECMSARQDPVSPCHILKPTGLDLDLHKSSIDDLNIPKLRLYGTLPDVVVKMSDERLIELAKLGLSIPLPKAEVEPEVDLAAKVEPLETGNLKNRAKMRAIMEVNELDEEAMKRADREEALLSSRDYVDNTQKESSVQREQMVQIDVNLKLNQIGVEIYRGTNVLMSANIRQLGFGFQMRTNDMKVQTHLGSLTVEMPSFKSLLPNRDTLFLIDNFHAEGDHLMRMTFIQANKESPFFKTEYRSTEQLINFNFETLNVTAHQEALMALKSYGEKLQKELEGVQKKYDQIEQHKDGRKISRKQSMGRASLLSFASSSNFTNDPNKKKAAAKKKKLQRKASEVDENVTKMELNANIISLKLLIGSNAGPDSSLDITGAKAAVLMKAKETAVKASLRDIKMLDETPNAAHKQLMVVQLPKNEQQHDMFMLDFVQLIRTDEERKKMSTSDHDMTVRMRFAQMRFVFLNIWLNRMLNWISPFQEEAAAAAASAQQAAQAKATEAAQNVKEMLENNPQRIRLDVELNAPAIVVPRLSTSDQALWLDLGKLVVKNSFSVQHGAVVDTMVVQIKDVHIAAARLARDHLDVAAKCNMLKPLTFTLTIHRNLSFASLKQLPEIALDAHLSLIDLSMAQQDYALVMHTLAGNLAEGSPPPPKKPVQVGHVEEAEDEMVEKPGGGVVGADKDKKTEGEKKEEKKDKTDYKRIVFQFQMDEIDARLYTGDSGLETGEGTLSRNDDKKFGQLIIAQVKVSGWMTEQGAIDTSLSVLSFTMDDRRPADQTKISRLMDKKNSNTSNSLLVSMKYEQNAKGDKQIDVTSSSFFLYLCPEFLGALSSFFVVPKPPEEEDQDAMFVKRPQQALNAGNTSANKTQVIVDQEKGKPQPTITLKARIQDIEVILIENSMDPENSQALILSFSCKSDITNLDNVQQVDARIQNLGIVSTYFSEKKRHLAHRYVLRRLDVVLSGSINNETKAQDFAICIDTIHLKVSPAVILLLSAVASSFSANKQVVDTQASTKSILRSYPDYWEPKKLKHADYWWFTEVAQEASDDYRPELEIVESSPFLETASFNIEKFIITVEADVDDGTIPLILIESGLEGSVSDWSGRMQLDSAFKLQMSYFNETFSVWEPVIEPIQRASGDWDPWQLTAKVRTHSEEEAGDGKLPPPKMTVEVAASEMMNLTMTKSFIQLTTQLGEVFEKAAKQIAPPKKKELPGNSPYLIKNETGIHVQILNSDTMKVNDTGEAIDASHGYYVELNPIGWEQKVGLQPEEDKRRTDLLLKLLDTQRPVDVHRAVKRCVRLPKHADSGKQWSLVVDTAIESGRRVVTLKSLVNFVNHMDVPMEVYSMRDDTNIDSCGTLEANSETALHVPLEQLYTATGQFFFRPANDLYETSAESISWNDFDQTERFIVRCDNSENPRTGLFVDAVVETEDIHGESGKDFVDKVFTVHLYPPLFFRNLLPMEVHLTSPIEKSLKGGEDVPLNLIAEQELSFWVDNDGEYDVTMRLKRDQEELEVVSMKRRDKPEYELNLGLHWTTQHKRRECEIYSPYWIVNSTGKTLAYLDMWLARRYGLSGGRRCNSCISGRTTPESRRLSQAEIELIHEPNRNPVLLPFAEQKFRPKKKCRLRVENSALSEEFPLDIAGHAGRVKCKSSDGREYEVTVEVNVTYSGLTKIVTFTAFYLLYNNTKFPVELREQDSTKWLTVDPNTCVCLWPTQNTPKKLLALRYKGDEEETAMFPFTEQFEEFCPTNGSHVGFYVTCSVGESSSVATVESFQQGMASALLINDTDKEITLCQKGVDASKGIKLSPQEQRIFTYSDLCIADKKIEWKSGDHSSELSLVRTDLASYEPAKGRRVFYYWACFLNGRQRTILFTQDLSVATTAKEAYEVERIDMQVDFSLHGIGISLVNNLHGLEVLYMSMSSSGLIWEHKPKNRFKPLTVKVMTDLEQKYQEWILRGKPDEKYHVDGTDIDFAHMIMKKKGKSEVSVRRSFQTGFWLQYRQSLHQTQMHLKINHLQIDNLIPSCVFPVVLAVVPPPRSIVADNEPKPFTEVSFIMSQSEHSKVVQIKYLHVLVQEFAVRVDKGLLVALMELSNSEENKAKYTPEIFAKDMELAKPKLQEKVATTAALTQKAYYDDLHISPLMIHLSFSQGGASGHPKRLTKDGKKVDTPTVSAIPFEFVELLLKSVGVTLTELQDVVFRLAYFDRRYTFYSSTQLQTEVQSHYTKQFIKQLYVLVLGLDIIGNPFGLVRDLSSGVEDLFYQPFQATIQGPEEFAEGLALGVSSLFGHAVGGAAGAVSRITGTLGKGVAALTLDEDYQRKRQEALNRKPQNFGEGITRAGENLTQGVVDGVTGIFTKPMEGARQGGVVGFTKGIGKGLIGAVTRPASGLVDFASGSLNAVKTVASNAEDAQHVRPARVIPPDLIVRPYNYNDSCGAKIFNETDRGRYADTENFIAHAFINEKSVFVVTDKRVFMSVRQSLGGAWTTGWSYTFEELKRPFIGEDGIKLELKQTKKGFLGIGNTSGKGIKMADKKTLDQISQKLLQAYDQI